MARRLSRGRFVRPAPKTKIWIGNGLVNTTIAGSSTTLLTSLAGGALLLRPFTILRSHMEILFKSDQTSVSEVPQGAYGETVVSDNASAVGVTAVPNPSSVDGDPDADWYVWQALASAFVHATNAAFIEGGRLFVIDSKAMRKVGANDDIVGVVDMQSGPGATIMFGGRTLIQLH